MKTIHDRHVRMIPLDNIKVLNERRRGQSRFKQIVTNIANVGLKKPIVVAERRGKDGVTMYHTACGQGRYESFKVLGQAEIPALVIDADDETLLVMSLVENLARRNRTSLEMVREIQAMKERGSTNVEIGKKVDLDPTYIGALLRLLRRGEERLIIAVEHRDLPLSVALTIAESSDADVQKAMMEAFQKGELRGKALERARRLVESRQARGKRVRGGTRQAQPVTTDLLIKEYRKETAKQQLLVDRARICQGRLSFVVSALRRLLANESFVNLLRAEGLTTLPKYLATHIQVQGAEHAP